MGSPAVFGTTTMTPSSCRISTSSAPRKSSFGISTPSSVTFAFKTFTTFAATISDVRARPPADGAGPKALLIHRVRHLNLAADYLLLRGLDLLDHVGRDERLVVLVHRVGDAVGFEAVDVEAALELVVHHVGDDLVDGVVDALDHAREDEAGLDAVLVRVDAYDVGPRAPLRVAPLLLDRVEDAEAGVAGGREYNVRALAYLRERQLLALARVVPRAVGDADVVVYDVDLGVDRLRALLVASREAVYEADVHAADEAYGAGLRLARGDHADEVGALVLLEDERGDVRQVARAVDDGEVYFRVVLRDRLHDGRLREADADDEVVAALGEGAHRGLDGGRVARLHVAQDDAERGLVARAAVRVPARLGALHAVEGGGV